MTLTSTRMEEMRMLMLVIFEGMIVGRVGGVLATHETHLPERGLA